MRRSDHTHFRFFKEMIFVKPRGTISGAVHAADHRRLQPVYMCRLRAATRKSARAPALWDAGSPASCWACGWRKRTAPTPTAGQQWPPWHASDAALIGPHLQFGGGRSSSSSGVTEFEQGDRFLRGGAKKFRNFFFMAK